ncbi:MAG TPA: transposase [Thermoguttaceae bacterium]|nr:transposase [Thermoguttaceae bacterium]
MLSRRKHVPAKGTLESRSSPPTKFRRSDVVRGGYGVPQGRCEDEESSRPTSFAGLVIFQKLFSRLALKRRLAACFAHLRTRATYRGREFIRRFLMHTLPSGFVRIRYYGFLANRDRSRRLDLCRRLLGVSSSSIPPSDEVVMQADALEPCSTAQPCPACGRGTLIIVDFAPPIRPHPPRRPYIRTRRPAETVAFDTS